MPFPDAKYPYDQRLAKAAPELLAACKALRACLLDWVDIASDDDQRDDDHAALAEAAAAIMQAEGGL